jgi:hypothetical protein
VVEGARAEHRYDRAGEDGCGRTSPTTVGVGDEQRPDDKRDEEGALVKPAAEERPLAVRHRLPRRCTG